MGKADVFLISTHCRTVVCQVGGSGHNSLRGTGGGVARPRVQRGAPLSSCSPAGGGGTAGRGVGECTSGSTLTSGPRQGWTGWEEKDCTLVG